MDLTYKIFNFLETHQLETEDICLSFSCDEETKTIQFYVGCNDLFFWGCADAEDITEENFHLLEESYNDLKKIDPEIGYYTSLLVSELFCARSRKMRPQGAAYPKDEKFFDLFNACGPERKTGLGNPHVPGGYRPRKKKSWWNFFKG